MAMTFDELKDRTFAIAKQMAQKGAGYAQEIVVLREVENTCGKELMEQSVLRGALPRARLILTVWHDLFRDGKLSWGYDLDNPNAPFFHLAVRKTQEEPASVQ